MKILYGTGNPAKLLEMKKRLKSLSEKFGIEIIGLKDINSKIPEITEDGSTPLENAHKKAITYYNKFKIPVFSCDSGLYFENVPDEIQPGVHVRTVNGKYLTDNEMIEYYSCLAHKYGDLTAYYQNAICFIYNDQQFFEAMDSTIRSDKFIITEKPHSILKKGFPLDSLSIDIKTSQYYYHLPEQEATNDGFLRFFMSSFEQIKLQKLKL